jgi:hypothetical protein
LIFFHFIKQERQRRRNAASSKAKEIDSKIKQNILEAYAIKSLLGKDFV